MWLEGFICALSAYNLLCLLAGTLVGLIVGALPGLGPLFGVSLALPFTVGMPPESAIILLSAIHAATAYGDSIASILVRVPGSAATVAACWDGYPMTQQGRGAVALAMSALGSLFGGLAGWIALVVISGPLVRLALKMHSAEYFMVALVALSLLAVAGSGNMAKGLLMGFLGLLLSTVGQDLFTGGFRFTLGSPYLESGIPMVPAVLGLFAISQALVLAEEGGTIAKVERVSGGALAAVRETVRHWATVIRGALVGVVMGILPALGLSSANVVAYLIEKRVSRDPESFGRGNPAGVLAPETAKSACVIGDLIPTVTLGIPGSPTTAIFMAALILHGLRPGPDFFQGKFPYVVFAGILMAQFAFFIIGLLCARYLARIVLLPNAYMVPTIIALSLIGAYAANYSVYDMWVALAFGVLGYVMQKYGFPSACLVLGFVLGNIAETNFVRALMVNGSYVVFVTRPISLALLLIAVVSFLSPWVSSLRQRSDRSKSGEGVGKASQNHA
ncbi:MAG: tripartite tricarboxylate transporter permease [Bacillota bacterium]